MKQNLMRNSTMRVPLQFTHIGSSYPLFFLKNSQKWKYLKKRPVDKEIGDEIRHCSPSWVSQGVSDDCQTFYALQPPKLWVLSEYRKNKDEDHLCVSNMR